MIISERKSLNPLVHHSSGPVHCLYIPFSIRILRPAEFLVWLPKNVRILKYSYLQALLEKHARDTW